MVFMLSCSLSDRGNNSTSNSSGVDSSFSDIAYGKESKDDNDEVTINDPEVKKAKEALLEWIESHTGGGYNAPNAVLAMLHKGRVVIKRAIKTTNDHLFNAASHSKLFTFISILQLADRGLINIDKPLSLYLPVDLTIKEIGSAPVTIRHMLSHTSGYMGGSKQSWRTGRGYYYSNEGYMLLAKLIPALTGKSLSEYISENIVKPMGMPYAVPDDTNGAAHFKWSLEDMVIFLKMIHGRGMYRGKRIIAEKWFDYEVYKPVRVGLPLAKNKTYRGLCFRVLSIDDRPFSINHAALTPGSGGWFHYYPKHDISFIVMTNSPTADLLDDLELEFRWDKEKQEEEREKTKKFMPRVHLDPLFASWYFPFCREAYKFMGVLSHADINPLDFRDTSTSPEIVNRYPGKYVDPVTKDIISVTAEHNEITVHNSVFGSISLLSSGPSRFFPQNGNEEFFFVPSSNHMCGLVYKTRLYLRSEPKIEGKKEIIKIE